MSNLIIRPIPTLHLAHFSDLEKLVLDAYMDTSTWDSDMMNLRYIYDDFDVADYFDNQIAYEVYGCSLDEHFFETEDEEEVFYMNTWNYIDYIMDDIGEILDYHYMSHTNNTYSDFWNLPTVGVW